jgi:hypothetical protein
MDVYENFALSGEDTIINDISYKKLYIFYNKTFDKNQAKCIGGIREDEHKRVYFRGDSLIHHYKPIWVSEPPVEEIMLYDFSAEIGDTVMFDLDNGIFLCIKNIDTLLIGDRKRRVYSFSFTDATWIEGIGNTRGLLFSSFDLPIGGENGELICFLQNGIIQYHNDYYDNCFPSTLSADIKQMNPEISVCSNPLEQQIQFKWYNFIINRIEIFNVQGVLIDVINVRNDSTEANYPTERMQSGVYIYRANSSNGYSQTGRFVVE